MPTALVRARAGERVIPEDGRGQAEQLFDNLAAILAGPTRTAIESSAFGRSGETARFMIGAADYQG